jgi:hypothetical protein
MGKYSVLAYGGEIPLEKFEGKFFTPNYGDIEVYGFRISKSKITVGGAPLETAESEPAEMVFGVLKTGKIVFFEGWTGKVVKSVWFTRCIVESNDMFSE